MAYESGLAIAQGRYQLGNYIAAMSEAMLTLDLKPGTFLHARYGFVLLVSPVCVAVAVGMWLWLCARAVFLLSIRTPRPPCVYTPTAQLARAVSGVWHAAHLVTLLC